MNYAKEANLFYVWLETNSVPTPCIVLWHALMHINNRTGWRQEFTVAISTLEVKTGLKKTAIVRARARLQQLGRLEFKSRNGQQSAIYKMISLEDEFEFFKRTQNEPQTEQNSFEFSKGTQSETQSAPQTEPQSGTQSAPINILNNTKLNNSSSLSSEEDEKAITKYGCVQFFHKNIHSPTEYELVILREWLGKYQDDLVVFAMQLAIQNNAANMNYISKVLLDWDTSGVKTIADAKIYYEQWQTKKKQRGNVTSFPNSKAERFTKTASHNWDFNELERLEQEHIQRKLQEQ